MIIVNCKQRSDQWFKARAGVVTASKLSMIVTSQGKTSAQRKTYMNKLAAELLLSRYIEEKRTSYAMDRGVDLEDDARKQCAFILDKECSEVGFIFKDDERRIGGSPDGLFLNDQEGLEIKCPMAPAHVGTLLADKMPTEHIVQVQGNLWVTGYKAWHFWSYHPDFNPFHAVIKPDKGLHEVFDVQVEKFLNELDAAVERIGEADVLKKYKEERYQSNSLPWEEFSPTGENNGNKPS